MGSVAMRSRVENRSAVTLSTVANGSAASDGVDPTTKARTAAATIVVVRILGPKFAVDLVSVSSPERTDETRGFTYVGNQGLTDKTILVLKAAHGRGEVAKYNSAYAAGVVYKQPFNRPGDQWGFSLQANEKNEVWEYGIDSYYKFSIRPWITVSVNLQLYNTDDGTLNTVPGLRLFLTY